MAEGQLYQLKRRKLTPLLRAFLEVGFIVFLFYSNLLMGEFTRSGLGQSHGLLWAVQDIFTKTNFIIAIIAGVIGHLVFGFFRNKL
jgi:hypothetical protein